MSDHARIIGAGLLLFATAVVMGVLIITLGSTPFPLEPNENYVNREYPGYECIRVNTSVVRCRSCVLYNATTNERNCTTCSVTTAKPHVWSNCSNVISNLTVPVTSLAAAVPASTSTGAGAASPSASGPTTTVTSTITVTTTLVGSSTVPVGANANAGSPSADAAVPVPVAPLVE